MTSIVIQFAVGVGASVTAGIIWALIRAWPNWHRYVLRDAAHRFIPLFTRESELNAWMGDIEVEYKSGWPRFRYAISIWAGAREIGRLNQEIGTAILANAPTDLATFLPAVRSRDPEHLLRVGEEEYLKAFRDYHALLKESADAPVSDEVRYSLELARLARRRERLSKLYVYLRKAHMALRDGAQDT